MFPFLGSLAADARGIPACRQWLSAATPPATEFPNPSHPGRGVSHAPLCHPLILARSQRPVPTEIFPHAPPTRSPPRVQRSVAQFQDQVSAAKRLQAGIPSDPYGTRFILARKPAVEPGRLFSSALRARAPDKYFVSHPRVVAIEPIAIAQKFHLSIWPRPAILESLRA